MILIGGLFVYFVMTLPVGLIVAIAAARIKVELVEHDVRRDPTNWFIASFVSFVAAAVIWAVLGHPLPNGRPALNELPFMFITSSPFIWRDDQHLMWFLLIEAVNLSFFAAVGALVASKKRHFLNAAFVFALVFLIGVPVALFASIPPCPGCID